MPSFLACVKDMNIDTCPFTGDGEGLQTFDPRTACWPEACWVCHFCAEGHQGKTYEMKHLRCLGSEDFVLSFKGFVCGINHQPPAIIAIHSYTHSFSVAYRTHWHNYKHWILQWKSFALDDCLRSATHGHNQKQSFLSCDGLPRIYYSLLQLSLCASALSG